MVVPAFLGLLLVAAGCGMVTGQSVEINPREAVRRAGQDLTVLCKVDYPIDSCRMTVGKTSYRLLPSIQDGDVVYSGQGLQFGECGAHIRNVREEWNGPVTCVLPPPAGSIELTGTMRLVVAKAPEPPQLVLGADGKTEWAEGEQFDAQCVVPRGRPHAKITWFLSTNTAQEESEPLLAGLHAPVVVQEPDSELVTIKQNVSRRLTADDAGRRLLCRAEHQAWDAPRDVATQLVVHFPPRRADGLSDNQLTVFGLRPGAPGRLNVTLRASPVPQVAWTLAGVTLTPPTQAEEGRIMALEPIILGGGYYNVSLVLSPVAREDVERTFLLRARNSLGDLDLSVRVSALDEPAGVDLDAGAIVGIVVGALVLILAVSLVVFAKATDRWCFAGRRDPAKSSGESDTESAAGGAGGAAVEGGARGARARLAAAREWGARVRAALPTTGVLLGRSNRDKVTAAELADDEKPGAGDEKKSVVYAELALSDTPAAPGETPRAPAPVPATEYAEIVYTDQGQKTAKE